MRHMHGTWAACAALLLGYGAAAQAAGGAAQGAQAAVAGHWRALAQADAEAALRLIADNHPGAVAALGDKEFLAHLALARQHVRERLPRVDSFGGYSALMSGLAADFKDGHIWSSAQVGYSVRRWAGVVPLRRGGKWIAALHEPGSGEASVAQAEIMACDGVPFDRWARDRIDRFGGNARLEADLAKLAPGLLLNDANPFAPAPTACTFRRTDGSEAALTLKWRPILQVGLFDKVKQLQEQTAPGMGVAEFAGGYWIRVSTLGSSAAKVVDAVRAQRAALQAAPMVVLDLRGNGGGNSAYAKDIAKLLVGEARLNATDTIDSDCQGQFWRASADNLQEVTKQRDAARQRDDKDTAEWYGGLVEEMTAALAAKRAFAPALPACAARAPVRPERIDAAALPPAEMKGKLVLITDRVCFSSCLIAANTFRRLGALHVGEATNMSTRYMEVREIVLPSGMRTFSTLQKVALGVGDFGPYQPEIVYEGSLADEAALKAWVAGLTQRAAAR